MDFPTLAAEIEQLDPNASQDQVAQIAMLMLRSGAESQQLQQTDVVHNLFNDIKIRLNAACDQHAAMTDEIQSLACSDPRQYSPDEVWVLVRAIKVQCQLLETYTGNDQFSIA